MDEQLLFFICIFGVVAFAGWGIMRLLLPSGDGEKIRERLVARTPTPSGLTQPVVSTSFWKDWFQKIGQAAAKPFMPETREKQSALRRKLSQAGIYSTSGVRMVTGCKVILLGAGVTGGYLLGMYYDNMLLGLSLGGLSGYLAPSLWLKARVKRQQQALDYGLPDALDLMVVCVEAGLAIDAAMQRVGQELNLVHAPLAREMDITQMETRMGLPRAEALRNLGQRTGNNALQSFGSMVIQAERFGTSITTALRVHAESLRQLRSTKAEEMAAKASVKLSFPLVLFIFPATFIVLAGQTIVQVINSPLFN